MDIFFWTFGILAVVVTATIAGGVTQALGYRFRKPRAALKREDEIPAVLAPFFRAAEEFLFSEGFGLSHCQASELMEHTSHPVQWGKVYLHPEEHIYATVNTATLPEEAFPATVGFISFFSDGSRLLTVNCLKYTIIGDMPSTELLDPYSESPRDALQAHRKRLDELRVRKKPVTHTPASLIEDFVGFAAEYIDSLVAKGLMAPAGDGLFRFTFSGAFRFVLRASRGAKLRAAVLKKARNRLKTAPASGPDAVPPLPVAVEVQAFLRHRSLIERLKVPRTSKAVLFFCTLALFLAIGAAAFDLFYTLALLAALIVHELGHALGMRVFGYRNINVMLLPMMGALTTGLPKGKKKPWQEAIILLMGPVPGLIIGAGLFAAGSFADGGTFPGIPGTGVGIVFIIINAFNLLPVMPLDGGRLVNLLLLGRSPRLQSVFMVLSMLAAGTGAYFLREPVLGFLAVALFFMSRKSFQYGGAVKSLRARPDWPRLREAQEHKALAAVFRQLRGRPFKDLNFIQKIRAAQVLHEAAFGPRPAILTSLVFLGIYCSIIIVPIAVLNILLLSGLKPMPTRDYHMNPDFMDGLRLTYSRPYIINQPEEPWTFESTYAIRKAEGEDYAYSFTYEVSSEPFPLNEEDEDENEGMTALEEPLPAYLSRKGKVWLPEELVGIASGDLTYPQFWIPAAEVQPGDPLFGFFRAKQAEKHFGRYVVPLKLQGTMRFYDLETGFLLFSEVVNPAGNKCTVMQWLSESNDKRLDETTSLINKKMSLQKNELAECLSGFDTAIIQ